jgi:hypothetical protein
MNARELMGKHTRCMACYREADWALIQQALSLLADAEANDGSTPETDALVCAPEFLGPSDHLMIDHARTLEQQRNGLARELAARTAELEEARRDAERYRAWRAYMIDGDCSRDGEAASDESCYDNMVDGIIDRKAKAQAAIDAAIAMSGKP